MSAGFPDRTGWSFLATPWGRRMPAPRILVFAGSWREGSLNTKLATLAARRLRTAGAQVKQISLSDY
ncbi:MAG: NADPH-dependent FMN reductase, partial [Sphingomonadaceae bacterium]